MASLCVGSEAIYTCTVEVHSTHKRRDGGLISWPCLFTYLHHQWSPHLLVCYGVARNTQLIPPARALSFNLFHVVSLISYATPLACNSNHPSLSRARCEYATWLSRSLDVNPRGSRKIRNAISAAATRRTGAGGRNDNGPGKRRVPRHSRRALVRSYASLADIYSTPPPETMGGTRTRSRTGDNGGATTPSGVLIFVTSRSLAPTRVASAVDIRSSQHLGRGRANNRTSKNNGMSARDKDVVGGHEAQSLLSRPATKKVVQPIQRLAWKHGDEQCGKGWRGDENSAMSAKRSAQSPNTTRLSTGLVPGTDAPSEGQGPIAQQLQRRQFRQTARGVKRVGSGGRDDTRRHTRTVRSSTGNAQVTIPDVGYRTAQDISRTRALVKLTNLHRVYGEEIGVSTSGSGGSPKAIAYPVVFGSNKTRVKSRNGIK